MAQQEQNGNDEHHDYMNSGRRWAIGTMPLSADILVDRLNMYPNGVFR